MPSSRQPVGRANRLPTELGPFRRWHFFRTNLIGALLAVTSSARGGFAAARNQPPIEVVMFRLLRLTAFVLPAFAVSGCATMMVSSHVQRDLDFVRYRTYDWGPADALPTGDPRLDRDPFFQDHMQGAVETQLAKRGLALATSGTPDLLIHYHANVSERIDVNRIDRQYGYCYADDCSVRVMEYEAGTLILDVVDARTDRVIWRGWAQDSLDGVIGNPDRMERMINQAVARMLEMFPAGQSARRASDR
jgi:hypothetical protein